VALARRGAEPGGRPALQVQLTRRGAARGGGRGDLGLRAELRHVCGVLPRRCAGWRRSARVAPGKGRHGLGAAVQHGEPAALDGVIRTRTSAWSPLEHHQLAVAMQPVPLCGVATAGLLQARERRTSGMTLLGPGVTPQRVGGVAPAVEAALATSAELLEFQGLLRAHLPQLLQAALQHQYSLLGMDLYGSGSLLAIRRWSRLLLMHHCRGLGLLVQRPDLRGLLATDRPQALQLALHVPCV